jgi:hypothetical protein
MGQPDQSCVRPEDGSKFTSKADCISRQKPLSGSSEAIALTHGRKAVPPCFCTDLDYGTALASSAMNRRSTLVSISRALILMT